MTNNVSKYVQLNDFLLLEYEFNRDGSTLGLTSKGVYPYLAKTEFGTKQYFNNPGIGWTNNTLEMQSVPTDVKRSNWYVNPDDISNYYPYFDSSTSIDQDEYPHDIVKIHIVSGYNFDDVAGFLLQIRAEDTSNNLVDISNFTWIKQILGSSVMKFSHETLNLGSKFYDKYTELKIPSIGTLGGQSAENIEKELSIKQLSDIFLQYSTITDLDNDQYLITEQIQLELPVTSNADKFNCFITESTAGDYIEYYATWENIIIGEFMGEIESGRIPLYTSNNPNDSYQEFINQYGTESSKWVVIHEIQVYEHVGNSDLLSQRFQFTQEDNFLTPNKFRPVIINSDIASSYSIHYICRLMNRMDGTQIIRKASFASTDPKKYGKHFNRINIDNYIPYKVFNRVPAEKANIINNPGIQRTKYAKVFYDTTNIVLNINNEIIPQGTGPLFLKNSDSIYKFKFEKINKNTDPIERNNVDLSGTFNYALIFVLDDDTKIEIIPTYSNNMNITLGELEFKIMGHQINNLLKQRNNKYSIIVKNPDGTSYTFYEGIYYDYGDYDAVISQYKETFDYESLNNTIADLESQIQSLEEENAALKSEN